VLDPVEEVVVEEILVVVVPPVLVVVVPLEVMVQTLVPEEVEQGSAFPAA
jgi:hypothetical protein